MANQEHLIKLNEGVESWNQWREENPSIIPDLSQASLKGMNLLGANLSNANLIGTNLTNAFLKGANLSRALLSQAKLSICNLAEANFSGAQLNQSDLSKAYLLGANFAKANLKNAFLIGANMRKANFMMANLSKAYLTEGILLETILTSADLSQADLSGIKVSNSNFSNVTLTGACIENWQIDLTNNFDNVVCDYVYLEANNKSRLPLNPNKMLAPEEFQSLVINVPEKSTKDNGVSPLPRISKEFKTRVLNHKEIQETTQADINPESNLKKITNEKIKSMIKVKLKSLYTKKFNLENQEEEEFVPINS